MVGRYLRVADSKPAIVPAGSKAGRTSQCVPLAEVIEQALLAGLSAQRIYRDLVGGHQFTGAYDAVKRFVRRLEQKIEPPFRRMECAPGAFVPVCVGSFAQGLLDTLFPKQGTRRRKVGKNAIERLEQSIE